VSDFVGEDQIASPTKFDVEDLLHIKLIQTLTRNINKNGTIDILLPENYTHKSILIKHADFTYDKHKDVTMDVTVLGRLYGMSIAGDGYKFYPESPYLDALSKGGPINIDGASVWWDYYDIQFPSLDIKVTNNSDKTINFTKAIFDIEESIKDTRALPVIHSNPCVGAEIYIDNEGWGGMENAEMHFNIVSALDSSFKYETELLPGRPISRIDVIRVVDPNIFEGPYRFVKKLGLIDEYTRVNLSAELSELGINEKVKRMLIYPISESSEVALKAIPFFPKTSKNGYSYWDVYDARIYGHLKYTQFLNGNKTPTSIDFQTQFRIIPGDCGDGGNITGRYDGLVFDLNNKNYRRIVPISQYLKKGETDRFTIKMAAKKSSMHRFKFRLSFGKDDELVSPDISLNIYAPRSFAGGDK